MNRQQKDKTISASITLALLVATILLCSWIGYKLPDPPFEDPGMTWAEGAEGEVLGEIEGFGNNDDATVNEQSNTSNESSIPQDNSYTTSDTKSPVTKETRKEEKPVTATETKNESQTKPNEPTLNPNASFKKSDKKGTEGKGTNVGSGKEGSPDGNKDGNGGNGTGHGTGKWGNGTSIKGNFSKADYVSNKEGDVVVKIVVDNKGNIIEVTGPEKGSTLTDSRQVEKVKIAVKASKIYNYDPNGPEKQIGYITYKFRRQS